MSFWIERRPRCPRTSSSITGTSAKLGNLIAPGSVRLVVSDPPWLEHEDLRQPFAETVARILKPGGFACVYTGHFHLKEFLDALCGAGLQYRWLIACVNDDTMGAIRSSGSILTFWRPVLLFQKPGGKAKTPRILRDLIQSQSREKDAHQWQQPIDEAVLFVKTLTEPGDLLRSGFWHRNSAIGSGSSQRRTPVRRHRDRW